MHILIAGGAGFIGSNTSRLLLERGHQVTVVDDLSHGKRENVHAGSELIVQDIREPKLLEVLAAKKPDAVLHLAAQMDVRKSVADPSYDASVNVLGTVNLLEAAKRAGVRRFVFASSGGAVYGEQEVFPATESHLRRPSSPYGVSKLCGEEYLGLYQRQHGLSTLALRYANVYGPGQDPHGEAGVVAIFLAKMLAGINPVINGDGLQTRDYVHVKDVARINALALEGKFEGALNVGTALETTVVSLAGILASAVGHKTPLAHGEGKAGEQRRSVIDPTAARAALNWQPEITIHEGLAQTAQWFRKHEPR
jgi:UDP-glucose 4-epimerase